MFSDRWRVEIGHEKVVSKERKVSIVVSASFPGCGLSKFALTHPHTYTHTQNILQPSELLVTLISWLSLCVTDKRGKNLLRFNHHISKNTP